MLRRHVLQGEGAAAMALAAPSVAKAQGARVLRFIPHADLTLLDPIRTTADITRNHGYLVYDTLFGMDNEYRTSPQMAEGMTVENDGKLVRITRRDRLKWHDGERVPARHLRPDADGRHRRGLRPRRQDHAVPPQARLPAPAPRAGQAADMRAEAFDFVPYLPLGQVRGMTACRRNITGVLEGIASFWNVQRVTA